MLICPSCGTENGDGAKFCSECGASLAKSEPRRKERKFATALFADLVGSTALAEREDPEVVQSVVGRTFDRLSEEIARYEGLLEKFMGDAVLAVFGVPRSHEDDAERAVRAALEMQAVLSELNRGFAAEGKPTLAMRIGVEAGEVLVDVERAAGRHDRMLTGDAVNTAARLETSAEPGHIVVGPGVYASTKDVIEFRELTALADELRELAGGAGTLVMRPARLNAYLHALAMFVESRDEAEWIRDEDREPLAVVRGLLWPLEDLSTEAIQAALSSHAPRHA